jgi:hypothetical protein
MLLKHLAIANFLVSTSSKPLVRSGVWTNMELKALIFLPEQILWGNYRQSQA